MDAVFEKEGKFSLVIGGYKIKSILGEGGLGIVYLAKQLSMKRYVALKVLDRKWMKDEEFRKRFLLEARVVGKLSHSNLIQVFDIGYDKGHYYFSMEYVAGRTLEQMVNSDINISWQKCVDITLQILDALGYIWEKKLVHRDIKPSNIIVNSREIAKLGDFGFVKTKMDDKLCTTDEFVLGTPDYMSPEQAMGKENLGYRSDIYSLGATLYHLATKSAPYEGSESVVIQQHIQGAIPSPRMMNPSLPEGLCHIIEKMMAKEPEDRYQDSEKLKRDLLLVKEGNQPQLKRIDSGKSTIAREGEYFSFPINRMYKLEQKIQKLQSHILYYQIIVVFLCILLLIMIGVIHFHS